MFQALVRPKTIIYYNTCEAFFDNMRPFCGFRMFVYFSCQPPPLPSVDSKSVFFVEDSQVPKVSNYTYTSDVKIALSIFSLQNSTVLYREVIQKNDKNKSCK